METRLVVPQLQPFYRWAEPLSWALIRITAGLMLIPHGWPKLIS
jgi:putative oxidoreductase